MQVSGPLGPLVLWVTSASLRTCVPGLRMATMPAGKLAQTSVFVAGATVLCRW